MPVKMNANVIQTHARNNQTYSGTICRELTSTCILNELVSSLHTAPGLKLLQSSNAKRL